MSQTRVCDTTPQAGRAHPHGPLRSSPESSPKTALFRCHHWSRLAGFNRQMSGIFRPHRPLWRRRLQVQPAVYPRACGGTGHYSAVVVNTTGLSPRLRGNRNFSSPTAICGRSILAPAGEPGSSRSHPGPATVYPRACGGTWTKTIWPAPTPGLSPRLRGNLSVIAIFRVSARSIPAPAGEPPSGWSSQWDCKVYPRACGGTPIIRAAS